MNSETLETLLIDRALGQLSPEVEVLLGERLATDPAAARIAEQLRETVALAAAALPNPAQKLPLPPPTVALHAPRRTPQLLALAASFVAGAGIAVLAVRSAAPPREAPAAGAPVPAARPLDPSVRALPFWSKERALAAATKSSIR